MENKIKDTKFRELLNFLPIIIITVFTFTSLILCIALYNKCEKQEGIIKTYEDVSVDYDDDHDRYDCFVEEIGHIYVDPENVIIRFVEDSKCEKILVLRNVVDDMIMVRKKYVLYIFICFGEEVLDNIACTCDNCAERLEKLGWTIIRGKQI